MLFSLNSIPGIIEFLTSDHTIARELRSKVDFVIFPMMNPDGVFLGNARFR
jgi:murein tripeptide amidase MpaA